MKTNGIGRNMQWGVPFDDSLFSLTVIIIVRVPVLTSGFFPPPTQLQWWNSPHATSSFTLLEKRLTSNNIIRHSRVLCRMLLRTPLSEAALTTAIYPLHPSQALLLCHIQHGQLIFTFRWSWLYNHPAKQVSHCSDIHSLAGLHLTLNVIIKAKSSSCFLLESSPWPLDWSRYSLPESVDGKCTQECPWLPALFFWSSSE